MLAKERHVARLQVQGKEVYLAHHEAMARVEVCGSTAGAKPWDQRPTHLSVKWWEKGAPKSSAPSQNKLPVISEAIMIFFSEFSKSL